MYIRGEVLQACFGEPPIVYNLLLYQLNGTSFAMFARFEPEQQVWVAIPIPFILSSNRELLIAFTEKLREQGYILQTVRGNPVFKS